MTHLLEQGQPRDILRWETLSIANDQSMNEEQHKSPNFYIQQPRKTYEGITTP